MGNNCWTNADCKDQDKEVDLERIDTPIETKKDTNWKFMVDKAYFKIIRNYFNNKI